MVRRTSVVDFLKAYKLFMAACCCKKVAFAFSNKTIYDAVAGKSRLHIYGFQWPGLLRGLAARDGGSPASTCPSLDSVLHTRSRRQAAGSANARASLACRSGSTESRRSGRLFVRPEDLSIDPAEVLVVSSLCPMKASSLVD
jgi:hypothetical protein